MSDKKSKQPGFGVFAAKPWYLKRKFIKTAGSSLAVLILLSVTAFAMLSGDNTDDNPLIIPLAEASDLPGWWYKDYFGSSVCDRLECQPSADPDEDKLSNEQEFFYRSNPLLADTNNNGLTDGEDVAQNYDPSKPGRVTFEQAVSDDSIVGESLVFNEDIKKILNETASPVNLKFPYPDDVELNIIETDSKEALTSYTDRMREIISTRFPGEIESYIRAALENQNFERIEDIKFRALQTQIEIKTVAVPRPAVELHKNMVLFFDLLPKVVNVPPPTILIDEFSTQSNLWYDQVQMFSEVTQKLEIESFRLGRRP